MANLPIRRLGAVGVITDIKPAELPPNAFTDCNNVIFDDDSVQRAPVFKQAYPAIRSSLSYDSSVDTYDSISYNYDNAEGGSNSDSRFVSSYADPVDGTTVFVCDKDGVIRSYPGGNVSYVTPGSGLVTNESVWSHAQVAGQSILARTGMVPMIRNILDDPTYSKMANDWGATDTAAVVRGYNDFILLFDIAKGTTHYPTMVKWCNPVEYGAAVSTVTWDPSNPANVAGENVLGDLRTPIRDGLTLGSAFVIYAQDQLWLMEYTGSSFVFNFRKLPYDGGIINTNCVIEVEGRHYVFGESDIYMHDGNTKQSLADRRVRRRIYNTLNRAKQGVCFMLHDSQANLLYFCYNTTHVSAQFTNTQFTNQAAVYNYRSDTWSFMDLPNVVGGAEVDLPSVKPKIPVVLGSTDLANGLTESRVYALDLIEGGVVDLPVTEETEKPSMAERIGMDLDDAGIALPLRSYKAITGMVPQAQLDNEADTFTFQFGCADLPNASPDYQRTAVFNPSTDYKIDARVAGRYLAYKFTTETEGNFKFSGFDAEVKSLSGR
jgi:hypothetical protein